MVRRISLDYGIEGYVNLNIWSYSLEPQSRCRGKDQISLTGDIARHCLVTCSKSSWYWVSNNLRVFIRQNDDGIHYYH
jgi:hypothetical protein